MGESAAQVVADRWAELAPVIDRLMQIAGEVPPTVPTRSSLGGDDRATHPYETSHAVRQCLNTAADHLHAVKTLVHDLRYLHTAAASTLARAAIENAATAVRLLPAGLSTAWKGCSGFAHGRPWSSLGVLDREIVRKEVGATVYRLTNDDERVLWPVLCGVFAVEEAMRLEQLRRATRD